MRFSPPLRRPLSKRQTQRREPIPIRTAPPRPTVHRKGSCVCGGGCPACRAASDRDHPTEREAEAVAGRVMSMAAPEATPAVQHMTEDIPLSKQEEEEDEKEALQLQVDEEMEEEEEEALQPQAEEEELFQFRAETSGASAPHGNPMAGLGDGQALSAPLRSFFEPRFGRSFADVRIHDGSTAHARARDVHAQAFTFGRNIVFSRGRYSPESHAGRHLLAHELTHVVQQGKAAPVVQRWAVSGNNATSDAAGDTLWDLARQVGATGPDWTCIIPRSMRTARMSPPPADFNAHYERYVRIGDRFDVSNLRKRTGPSLRIHLFTSARDIGIAGRFYQGMTASSGDVDIDISTAATDGTTPIRNMIIFGHSVGATMFGGVGTFDPSALTAEPHSFNLANANLLPRRCWFTRNARVRSVGCNSMAFAQAFARQYLRRGSLIRSTTKAVSPCCHGVWDRLVFTASSAAGSSILDGPFRTARAFHRGRFWSRVRGRL